MVRKVINTGTTANDGTGDTLRTAGTKINDNFNELYSLLGGAGSGTTSLTDSGLTFIGTSFDTRLGFIEGASLIEIDLPDSSGTVLVTTAGQTMSNKTINVDSNDISGLPTSSFVLTNASGIVDGTAAQKAIPIGNVVGDSDTQILTNKTLTSPNITTPKITTSINDVNNNEMIKFTATGSAVNEITLTNAATGGVPSITATGTDTNVNIVVAAKGTGAVRLDKTAFDTENITATGTVTSTSSNYIVNGSSITATVADGTVVGEIKTFTNINASGVTVTPTNFSQGTSIALDQYDTVQLMWHSSNWHIIGGYGYAVS